MVVEVGPERLTHGYERPPYFYLNSAPEGVVCAAPVGGATTPNSSNPRSELRQLNPDGSPASWSNSNATWQLECRLAVTHYPTGASDRGVVCMQIHDNKDDVSVLRFERSGDVWITKGDTTHHHKIISGYVLGTWNTFRVVAAKGGGIAWYLNGTQVVVIPGIFKNCYFKWGAYVQIDGSSEEFGAAHFTYAKATKRNT